MRNKKAATCSSEGYSGDRYCTVCGTQIASGVTLEKLPHSWTKKQVTKAATCTEPGKQLWECGVCHTTETRPTIIDVNNHDWQCTKEAWDEDGAPVYSTVLMWYGDIDYYPYPKTDPRRFDRKNLIHEVFHAFQNGGPGTLVEGENGEFYEVPFDYPEQYAA